jgi:adenylate cyclase
LFDSFAAWCASLAREEPLLLVVEDVHWADSGTLALLRSLAQRLHEMPVLLVLTFRDTEVELAEARTLKEFVLDLNRARIAEAIQLPRLTHEQTRDLLVTILATGGEISAEFLESVYRETEGNPFFIEEVCMALIEAGKLYVVGDTWRRADIRTMVIPQSVRAAILSRIDQLPPVVQETVRLAAILGREFDFSTLQAMGDWDQETLIGALEHAERVHLVSEEQREGQLRFAFAHALIPFAVRESLSGLRRQQLHQRAARAITALRPDDVEALAYHTTAAGDREQAITYLHRAAQRANALYAYDTAADHLRAAISLVRTESATTRLCTLLEELGDVLRLEDQRAEAIPHYEEALRLARDAVEDDPITVARLCRKIGETVVGTDYITGVQSFEVAARAAIEEGLQVMAGKRSHPETVHLLVARSHAAWRTRVPPDWDAAERDAREATALAEQLGSPVEHSSALDALAVVFAARGRLRERVQITLERLALSAAPGFRETRERVHLLNEVGTVLLDVGEYVEALPYLREAERLATRIHATDELVRALQAQALCAFRLDRWDEVSMDERFEALRAQPSHQNLAPNCFHLALSAVVHALRGETAQARLLRDESLAFMAKAVPPERWGRTGHF